MVNEDRDNRIFDAFCDWLPYYWTPADDVPENIRLHVLCNGYPNVATGCNEIVNHELKGRKIRKKAGDMLRYMQVWKEMPDNNGEVT